jgi:hypothetical protein
MHLRCLSTVTTTPPDMISSTSTVFSPPKLYLSFLKMYRCEQEILLKVHVIFHGNLATKSDCVTTRKNRVSYVHEYHFFNFPIICRFSGIFNTAEKFGIT